MTHALSGMIFLAAFTLAGCGEPQQGLTGMRRDAFVSGIVAPCSKDSRTLGKMQVPMSEANAYCTCVGNKLADHATDSIATNPEALEAEVKPYLEPALAACRNASWSRQEGGQ